MTAQRREAARRELERRQREREAQAPISRADLELLFHAVAQRAHADGHDGTLSLTRTWLSQNEKPVAAVVSFLEENGVDSDWDVLVSADPHQLFGPTPGRLARMPLERGELVELLNWLERRLERQACQHDLRLTHEWLASRDLAVAPATFALIAQGGGCDCEVVLNVDPEEIYPR